MLNIKVFTFNPFQENTYLIYDLKGIALIIDPGCSNRQEEMELIHFIETNHLKIEAILNTHAHLDHIFGNQFMKSQYNVPIYLHKDDELILKNAGIAAKLYGINGYKPSPNVDIYLNHNDEITFGDIKFKVLHTPGHAPGHVVFYNKDEKFVINGDVLFRGSYGRTDLPGGKPMDLFKSITEVMFALPEDTIVHCGHGSTTTIGNEINSNPILYM